jgi:hypothetical protein
MAESTLPETAGTHPSREDCVTALTAVTATPSHCTPHPNGDRDAVDQLVELAGERGDMDELRRLDANGSTDAVDQLVELAGERGDMDELRRLANGGNRDAADVLTELADEHNEGRE